MSSTSAWLTRPLWSAVGLLCKPWIKNMVPIVSLVRCSRRSAISRISPASARSVRAACRVLRYSFCGCSTHAFLAGSVGCGPTLD